MTANLCLLCCRNFRPEIEAAVALEGWRDVSVADFPSQCGHPPLNWEDLRPLVTGDCTQVLVLGRACLKGLETPPSGMPPVHLLHQEECFHLVAGPTLVAEAIARGAYLMTPGWLNDWRGRLRELGFDEHNAMGFFRDFARELLLLDTGTVPDTDSKLAELSEAVGLPASRVAVGLDYTRLVLVRRVTEWRLDQMRRKRAELERQWGRELADQAAAMDILGRLALIKEEQETVAAIREMFLMLFAPEQVYYIAIEAGVPLGLDALPPELARQVSTLNGDWSWTESNTGFLLRISRSGKPLAVIVVNRVALPEHLQHYLNLALNMAGVCALAIENSRTFRRMKRAEEALAKSEQSLRIAQAIAHLGHWEWNVQSGEMRWSDETFRILGYEPKMLFPSRDNFFQVIHPDDRVRVLNAIEQAREGNAFDVEYRIVLPNGIQRVVHGMGTVLAVGFDTQPSIVGTIQDVTELETTEVLGVMQDITARKALEIRLAREAHTDPLTGCANRRHFQALARNEIARVRRYGGELSFLALDLDHFKAINDRYGHHVGDLTLRALVQICQGTLREEDVIGRIGGEEFAILLLETGRVRALEVAERLRRAVAEAEVPVEGKPPLHFTTSIGVATLKSPEDSIDFLMANADQALYTAKRSGRNCVIAEENSK